MNFLVLKPSIVIGLISIHDNQGVYKNSPDNFKYSKHLSHIVILYNLSNNFIVRIFIDNTSKSHIKIKNWKIQGKSTHQIHMSKVPAV